MSNHVQPTVGPSGLTHRRRMAIFSFLMLSLFMATLDNQVVSTALPTIIGEFGAIERFAWIGSAYLLAQSAIMPVYGKLGDLFGRKYVMMFAVGLFTIGSLLCGLSWSMDSLIAARVFQGLGAGGIMVSIFSINADLFEPRERARYQSFSSLVLMASGSIGPTLGGTMSQYLGWRSIFLINLPIGIIALAGLMFMLPYRRPERQPKIDYVGALTLAIAISGLVLWADSQSLFGSLTAWPSLALPVISALALTIWLRVERRAAEPVIPLGLFRDRNFSLLLIVGIVSGGIGIGLVNYHALFLQMTTGLSPAHAGLFFIAITAGIAGGSLTAGRLISRTGHYKPWLVLGLFLSTLCLAGLMVLPLHVPFWAVAAVLLAQGIAIGLGQQAPVIGVQIASPAKDVGAATGAVTLSRMGGAALAISIYGAILTDQLMRAVVPGVGSIAEMTPDRMAALPAAAREGVAAAFRGAFDWVYFSAVVIAAVGFLAAAMLRPVQLAPIGEAEKPQAKPADMQAAPRAG
ncbi:MDR family MFS transporter [Paracoccus sp. CPCC 101403]|uniref:MDR family MFS transporter n=1 Tax=Paracoccus broussonetiae TaxID=3075834 RepID=A0ABU3ECY9_9RHOB|nr:MDR family MFS transporter [Paracoccus sp. CPCC 101403]MDT1062096.1 MDR family MFS transporter [Paracoccus sp. CPCC 101403]